MLNDVALAVAVATHVNETPTLNEVCGRISCFHIVYQISLCLFKILSLIHTFVFLDLSRVMHGSRYVIVSMVIIIFYSVDQFLTPSLTRQVDGLPIFT
jgi:hypothetical protein